MHKKLVAAALQKLSFLRVFVNCELVETVVAHFVRLISKMFYLYEHLNLTNSFSNIHNSRLFDCKSCENENTACSNKDM